VDQIKQLRKSRDMVKLYNDRLERLQVRDAPRCLLSLTTRVRPACDNGGERETETETETEREDACPQALLATPLCNRRQEDDGHRRSLLERIKEKDQQLTATKALEAQQRSILDGVRAKEDAEVAAIPQLTAERNECYEIVKQAREALRTLRTEFKDAEDKWCVPSTHTRSGRRPPIRISFETVMLISPRRVGG